VKLYSCCTASNVFTIANHHTTLKISLLFKMAPHRPRLDGRRFGEKLTLYWAYV